MRRELRTFIAAFMLLALPSVPVRADAWSGPIGVMRPDGTVVVIRGDAAKRLSREHLTGAGTATLTWEPVVRFAEESRVHFRAG